MAINWLECGKIMILVYTGNGKGKTSACIGQAIRAMGQDLTVFFVQFMKKHVQAGEQIFLHKLLEQNFFVGGCGFFKKEEHREEHRDFALKTYNLAIKNMANVNMLILDESLYALSAGLLTRSEIEDIINKANVLNVHLVLSGRNAPDWLIECADLVTEMLEVKHPWQKGISATKGIEF